MPDKTYNGHKTRAHWNVALWIGNDEGLYNLAREAWDATKCGAAENQSHSARAARYFIDALRETPCASSGWPRTPDGARFTFGRVRRAIKGLEL